MASLQVKEFNAHTAAVNDLSFDVEGEYIGSCSDDGSVVIKSLFTDEKMKFEYHRPMKAIALDPDYAKKTSRRFVAGGLAGHLYFNSKKWLGFRDQVCAGLLIKFQILLPRHFSFHKTKAICLLGFALWGRSNTCSEMESKSRCLGK